MAGVTFDQNYFDALYRQNPDPWEFRSSPYEREKYAATLAALPRQHYTHALELGCAIGELTALLAKRANHVTAVDTSPVALDTARAACGHLHHVDFVQAHLPDGDWVRPADLVVLSEILYYLDAAAIDRLAARMLAGAADADIVLVHWTGATNYPMTGDDAVERFCTAWPRRTTRTFRAPQYRLDLLSAQ